MSKWICLIGVSLVVLQAWPVRAAEDQPAAEKPSAKSEPDAADGDPKDAKSSNPSLLDRLTKELFKELDEDPAKAAVKQKENKLERAAKGMRSAGEKLEESVTGDETRKIQEQVIRDLDDLINQLQNPPPPQGGGGGGGGSSSSQLQKPAGGKSSKPQQGAGQAAKGQSKQKESAKNRTGGHDKELAEGSEERTESERKAAEEAARKKKLEMDVWGHLPPHLRDQLLNTYGERMLPKYQQLVKQFYEALSEQGGSRR